MAYPMRGTAKPHTIATAAYAKGMSQAEILVPWKFRAAILGLRSNSRCQFIFLREIDARDGGRRKWLLCPGCREAAACVLDWRFDDSRVVRAAHFLELSKQTGSNPRSLRRFTLCDAVLVSVGRTQPTSSGNTQSCSNIRTQTQSTPNPINYDLDMRWALVG